MVFTSIEFLVFLPIVFLIYWFIVNKNTRLQNAFIVLASYVFYGWWDIRFLTLIVLTSFCSYGSGLLIERYRGTPKAKWLHIGNIAVNLCILVIFKYYNFFVTSFADLFLGGKTDGLLLRIILPVGISFYTFQAIGYTIDVYRNQMKPTSDIIRFFAFISFFPQLVAGPIERASHLLPQFEKPRVFNYGQATDGIRQILWGLFKKVVVADRCAVVVNEVFGNYTSYAGIMLFVAAILFAFQIYGDFSGYSDMAIGIAKLFGITLRKNFNVPFCSRNMSEFWRRWHISLTTWFIDYVYIPLGGSRGTKAMIIRNTFIVFILSGFWHGANWTFLAWGAYNAVLLIPIILIGKKHTTDTVAEGRCLPNGTELFSMGFTFFLFVFGVIIFRSESIGQAVAYIGRMCDWKTLTDGCYIFKRDIPVFLLILLLIEWFQRKAEHGLEFHRPIKWPVRYSIYFAFVLILIFYWGDNQQYIYFQF